jgi:hypothetical protein
MLVRSKAFHTMLYVYFWVIPRRLNFICRHFGTLCSIFTGRDTYLPMKMDQSVPKRRQLKFRRRGITQKKTYNIQNTAKVWNQEHSILIVYTPRINSLQKEPTQSKLSDLRHYGIYSCNLLLLRHILKQFPNSLLSPPSGSCATNSPNSYRTIPFSATHSLPCNTERTVWVHYLQTADLVYLVYLRTQ